VNDSLLQLFTQWDMAQYIYTVFLVFVRLAATISLMPGFGEQFVSPRLKIMIAVVLAYALQPVITAPVALVPPASTLFMQIGSEFLIGSMFGLWVRLMYMSLSIAAGFCAQVLGITNIFDAMLEPGGAPALSGFFSFTALAILSVTGGHYFIFQAFVKTYSLIEMTGTLSMADASMSIIDAGVTALNLGLRLSLPFLVIGFLMNIGLGFVNRAMPQIPVFFVGQPLMIGVGFIMMSLLISTMMFNWGEALRTFIMGQL
jgi:flagellar biosynthesis protein FliR